MDEQLILTYLAYHRLLEQALVRAGFVMALSIHKQPRPDWYRWARHIEKQFDPLSSEELGMAVAHLLDLRDDMETLPGRMQNRLTWESDSRFSDNLWLAEMLQRTSSLLIHRYNFAETPGCDTPQVMAALFVAAGLAAARAGAVIWFNLRDNLPRQSLCFARQGRQVCETS